MTLYRADVTLSILFHADDLEQANQALQDLTVDLADNVNENVTYDADNLTPQQGFYCVDLSNGSGLHEAFDGESEQIVARWRADAESQEVGIGS